MTRRGLLLLLLLLLHLFDPFHGPCLNSFHHPFLSCSSPLFHAPPPSFCHEQAHLSCKVVVFTFSNFAVYPNSSVARASDTPHLRLSGMLAGHDWFEALYLLCLTWNAFLINVTSWAFLLFFFLLFTFKRVSLLCYFLGYFILYLLSAQSSPCSLSLSIHFYIISQVQVGYTYFFFHCFTSKRVSVLCLLLGFCLVVLFYPNRHFSLSFHLYIIS